MVRRLVLLCVVMLVTTGIGFAANTGRISGTVEDNDGGALPGVTVQITSDVLIGGPQVAIAGADGGFAFNILLPGTYTVEAALAGFQPSQGDVRVAVNHVASIAFTLIPEQFGGEIEVVAEVPVVDTQQVNTSVVWDQDYLQHAAVGSGNRSYQNVLSQAAGVTGGSNPNVMGSTIGENSYMIDGMNTTDPVTGTWSTMFNMDAVQEMNFQTGGFEAEFGQATGGIINLVTKSGGNEFSGTVDLRYRDENFVSDGEYFDKDEQDSSRKSFSATLGGPIVRDRLWFFVAAEYVNSVSQNVGATFPYDWEGTNYLVKATWQVSDSVRAILKTNDDPTEITGRNSSSTVEHSAMSTQLQGGPMYQFELNSVLSESWLLNLQVGMKRDYLEGEPTNNPDTLSGHYNENSLTRYQNPASSFDDDRDRDEYRLNTTWFVNDFAGAHELKGGVEYSKIGFASRNWNNGGGEVTDLNPTNENYQDINGDGYFNHFITIKEPEATVKAPVNSTGDVTTFFVQDAWRPTANLTIKPGIRFDNVTFTNHAGVQNADMDRWQPRLGLAWDITGNAKHVVRASVGRFMDSGALGIPSFASGGTDEVVHEYNTLEYYCNFLGICDPVVLGTILRTDPIEWTNWDGQNYTLFDNRGSTTDAVAQTLDEAGVGHLEAPYADELIIAYETQIAAETSLEFTYIKKESNDIIEDTCSNNTWVYDGSELPSFDDPDTWTRNDGCEFWLIANIPMYERKYDAFIAKFETRTQNLHIISSYTYGDSRGTNISGPRHYAYGDADYFAVNYYNMYGPLDDHAEHRVKLNGYWMLPGDWIIGVDAYWQSAEFLSPKSDCGTIPSNQAVLDYYGVDASTGDYCYSADGVELAGYDLFLEPRGSVQAETLWEFDLQVSKQFRIGQTNLTAILAVLNLFDQELARTWNETAFRQASAAEVESGDLDDYDEVFDDNGNSVGYYMPIGQPRTYLQPRRFEIGLRFDF